MFNDNELLLNNSLIFIIFLLMVLVNSLGSDFEIILLVSSAKRIGLARPAIVHAYSNVLLLWCCVMLHLCYSVYCRNKLPMWPFNWSSFLSTSKHKWRGNTRWLMFLRLSHLVWRRSATNVKYSDEKFLEMYFVEPDWHLWLIYVPHLLYHYSLEPQVVYHWYTL
jgi:hypothetical protein